MKWFAERLLGQAMWFSVGVMALALIEGQASGQSCEHKIFASDGAADDAFGVSVSISGTPGNEVAIIGSQFDNDNGFGSGSVLIYRRSGVNWVEEVGQVAPAPCPAEITGDMTVNVTDLLAMLAAWGPNPGHAADINNDDTVNVIDLLAMLAAWGACP